MAKHAHPMGSINQHVFSIPLDLAGANPVLLDGQAHSGAGYFTTTG
jgi:hypothetical protein